MADKTGEGRSVAATGSALANQRLKQQTDLGKALMWFRGFGADESKAAFIRAQKLVTAIKDAPVRANASRRAEIMNQQGAGDSDLP
jgi:hypothetical protein